MYILTTSSHFTEKLGKLTRRNTQLLGKVNDVFLILRYNPFTPILSTHKVSAVIDGQKHFSSKVSADVRIIWDFYGKEVKVIGLIDLGGHTGQNKVYK